MPEDLTGINGILKQLATRLVKRALQSGPGTPWTEATVQRKVWGQVERWRQRWGSRSAISAAG